jgi:multimeric flavodoxin WrbA
MMNGGDQDERVTGDRPASDLEPRRGMPSPKLDRDEFIRRYMLQFVDPAFDPLRSALQAAANIAWDGYREGRKAPITRKAGPGFANPDYDISVDWLKARNAIEQAKQLHGDAASRSRILLINGSPRTEHTCPGEMSKSWRLLQIATRVIEADARSQLDMIDLSRLTSEYGRRIFPCKACFSTAAALCHWPCSCYPNHSLGQTQDWMNEIYPKWVMAHGVMIIAPVHWYQATSPLKLMIDRLVCADGGNPDPSSTHGKDASKAKAMELAGWDYPRHLAGRMFSVVVHGDTEGARDALHAICDWLTSMELEPAASTATFERYIGYWKPYATSHDDLDQEEALQQEVANAARSLVQAVADRRSRPAAPGLARLEEPRKK